MPTTFELTAPSVYTKIVEGRGLLTYLAPDGTGFNAGALVYQNGGVASECGADPTLILGVARIGSADRWLATYGAGKLASQKIPIEVIYDDTIVEMSLKGTFAATDIGTSYGLVKDATTGAWCVDKTDTTNTRVTVIATADTPKIKYAVGDVNPRVLVKFISTYLQASI